MSQREETYHGFSISQTDYDDITALTPTGSITFENCAELRILLERASERPQPTILLGGRRIGAVDSEALELLMEWHGRLSGAGGSLKLVALTDTCADILTATRLVHVLNVYEDIQQAIQDG